MATGPGPRETSTGWTRGALEDMTGKSMGKKQATLNRLNSWKVKKFNKLLTHIFLLLRLD
jgi:hypothetical protein